MRSAVAAFAVVFVLGLAGLLLVGSLNQRSLAFTLGVAPTTAAAELTPGHSVCQRPIDVTADFDEIRMRTAGPVAAAPAIDVEVLDARTGRRLANGRTDTGGGLLDGVIQTKEVVAQVRTVHQGQRVAVCLSTDGPRPALLYGNAALAARGTSAFLDGRRLNSDVALVFNRTEPRSLLALAPEVVDRAALFHGSLSAPWVLWVLAALLVLALPALLALALRAALDDRDQVRE
jgi:hypothetical protein